MGATRPGNKAPNPRLLAAPIRISHLQRLQTTRKKSAEVPLRIFVSDCVHSAASIRTEIAALRNGGVASNNDALRASLVFALKKTMDRSHSRLVEFIRSIVGSIVVPRNIFASNQPAIRRQILFESGQGGVDWLRKSRGERIVHQQHDSTGSLDGRGIDSGRKE